MYDQSYHSGLRSQALPSPFETALEKHAFDYDRWKEALLGPAAESAESCDLLAASGLLDTDLEDEFDEFLRQIQKDLDAIARSSRDRR